MYQLEDLCSSWCHTNSHQGSSLTRATCHFSKLVGYPNSNCLTSSRSKIKSLIILFLGIFNIKGPVRYFFVPMHFVDLEMVWYAFLAPRLGRKVPPKRSIEVKWLRDTTTRGAFPCGGLLAPLLVGGPLKSYTKYWYLAIIWPQKNQTKTIRLIQKGPNF